MVNSIQRTLTIEIGKLECSMIVSTINVLHSNFQDAILLTSTEIQNFRDKMKVETPNRRGQCAWPPKPVPFMHEGSWIQKQNKSHGEK